MKLFPILFSLLIISYCGVAQDTSTISDPPTCGADGHHHYKMKTDPDYRFRFLEMKKQLDSVRHHPPERDLRAGEVVTIPVVVHIIHLGEPMGQQSNISDEQILGAIDGLNERYANANGQGEDMEIRFCLATRDPDGCVTSGINRVDGSVVPGYREEGVTWDGECGIDDRLVKDLSKWPTWTYYNIWVVHDICGSIAGYAYYPNGNEYDGTVIDIASMRYENLTLAHELGHGLNIRHTFSGDHDNTCPDNEDCAEDGDAICDTPPHRVGDCGLSNPCATDGVWPNSYRNWMSYCFPPADEGRFTADQRTRMWDALAVDPRASLLTSDGCANPEGLRITSDGSILCPQEGRPLVAQPAGGIFEVIAGSGFIQDDILYATAGPQITIGYRIENDSCTSVVFQEIPVRTVPNLLLKSLEDSLCVGQSTTLQGIPSGGIYGLLTGPGDVQGQQLTALEEGMIKVYYERTLIGCVLRDTLTIDAQEMPVIEVGQLAEDVLVAEPMADSIQWVRCDLDFAPVQDGTSAVLQVSTTGEYAAVAFQGTCQDTSVCIQVVVTATREEDGDKLRRMYPNPVSDIAWLEGFPTDDRCDISLRDATGSLLHPSIVRQGERWALNMSGLLPGIYLVHARVAGEGYWVYKLVKG